MCTSDSHLKLHTRPGISALSLLLTAVPNKVRLRVSSELRKSRGMGGWKLTDGLNIIPQHTKVHSV
jgi:hypothetical protein